MTVRIGNSKSEIESILLLQILDAGLPRPEQNVPYIEGRRYTADFVWRSHRLVAELNGGTWARAGATKCPMCGEVPKGAHATGAGLERDFEKQNLSVLNGWRYLEFSTRHVKKGVAIKVLKEALTASPVGLDLARAFDAIRESRDILKVSQEQLAQSVGMKQYAISIMERLVPEAIRAMAAERCAAALGAIASSREDGGDR